MLDELWRHAWRDISETPPPENRWVLVWDKNRGLAMFAKWRNGRWFSCGNNIRKDAATHWAEVVGPTGAHSADPRFNRKTTRDS